MDWVHVRPRQGAGRSAITLPQVLFATACIAAVVVVTVLPNLRTRGCYAYRDKCVNNLKNVGLAFRIWATDHDDEFPFNHPGTQIYTNTEEVYRNFEVISNELNSPMILHCPEDGERKRGSNWATLTDRNLSYFLGLVPNQTNAEMLLAGDRH